MPAFIKYLTFFLNYDIIYKKGEEIWKSIVKRIAVAAIVNGVK